MSPTIRPLVVGLELTFIGLLMGFGMAKALNGGIWTYPLDDPYIHLAIARHLAQDGLWSIDGHHAFTSSSSSPLWTLVLAFGFRLLGVRDTLPLVLNASMAVLLIVLAHRHFKRTGLSPRCATMWMMLFVAFVPLVPLVLLGLEHVTHLVLTLLFFERITALPDAQEWWPPPSDPHDDSSAARSQKSSHGLGRGIALIAFALGGIRYEGLFTVAAAAIVLLRDRHLLLAGVIILCSAAIPALYGFISWNAGWFVLPNSLLLKSGLPAFHAVEWLKYLGGYSKDRSVGIRLLVETPHLLFLVGLALCLLITDRRKETRSRRRARGLELFVLTTLFHVQFARTGWFYRYEAYLVGIGILALAPLITEYVGRLWEQDTGENARTPRAARRPAIVAGLMILLFPFLDRSLQAHLKTPLASNDIFQQHYQMAQFIHRFFDDRTVAANDVGAIAYYGDAAIFDVYGLANVEVARARLEGRFDASILETLAGGEGVEIAVVYDEWLAPTGGAPEGWTPIGWWAIDKNFSADHRRVHWYAVKAETREKLRRALLTFGPHLPPGVEWAVE